LGADWRLKSGLTALYSLTIFNAVKEIWNGGVVMPRKGTVRSSRTVSSDQKEPESAAFSVRFTERARNELAQAAKLKGLSPTEFIRTTALMRAVQVCNAAQPSTIDFAGLARELSSRLFLINKDVDCQDENLNSGKANMPLHPDDPDNSRFYFVEPLPSEMLDRLVEVARYGGAEFLDLLVAECKARLNLLEGVREPVDPDDFLKK